MIVSPSIVFQVEGNTLLLPIVNRFVDTLVCPHLENDTNDG